MQDKINKKMYNLIEYLFGLGLKSEGRNIMTILKIASLNAPVEEIEIEGVEEVLSYLKENPGEFIFLDNPKKSIKFDNGEPLPFHYGEFVGIINPSDYMGWDVVISPSVTDDIVETKDGDKYIDNGHSLAPVGYIPVNESKDEWLDKAQKSPPIGNDKIILSFNKEVKDDAKKIIEDFFSTLWQFNSVIWL
jgi:hypothetical protein